MRDRFKLVGHLEPYDADDLALVALTYAGGATSSWTFRDHSYEVTGQLDELIDPETARQSLEYNDVDEHGLEQRDHRYLECLVREYLGGPVGLARSAVERPLRHCAAAATCSVLGIPVPSIVNGWMR